ncbi:MAG: hypothetical protein MHM6MM_006825, partial [Cercozoa sp. M6MM]
VFEFLRDHYVGDGRFRFEYSANFLRWALTPPGSEDKRDLLIQLRSRDTNQLVGLITGVPGTIVVGDPVAEDAGSTRRTMVTIDFLCVHAEYRNRSLAPLLIQEVTRRTRRYDIHQAVYTAGVLLPTPVSEAQYYHRILNVKKAIRTGFSFLPFGRSLRDEIRDKKPAPLPQLPRFQPLQRRHVASACQLLNEDLSRTTRLWQHFDEAEFAHMFLPRQGVVHSYVITDESDDSVVTDFASYYVVPNQVLDEDEQVDAVLNTAFLYYTAASTVPLSALVDDLLSEAYDAGIDVCNCLTVGKNRDIMRQCKFGPGTGFLKYYIYNWKTRSLHDDQVGLLLL